MKRFLFTTMLLCIWGQMFGQLPNAGESPRTRTSFDNGWLFALGHALDTSHDFNFGTTYFSYLAKTGYGDGAAAKEYDDRAWRPLNLPHDWCVELPFSPKGGHSHGFKAIGRNFPENSVGWYRKHFVIPASDLGKKISLEFDGVQRDSKIFVNGFLLGMEPNGNMSFSYDITDYLNYGAENVVSVRADATMEEGWYYEGAGIYRHTWLTVTAPLHVARFGTFVTTTIDETTGLVTARTTVQNEAKMAVNFTVEESVIDPKGKQVAQNLRANCSLGGGVTSEFRSQMRVADAMLWNLETPNLYKLITVLRQDGKVVDRVETVFGIRTVRFDPNEGFFLNEKSVKIVGTNVHQDHAGVGTAIPDALQEWRIKRLKEMGNNGLRTSHNPPTPELLEICDRLGFLVLDENRLMGINEFHYRALENVMKRDRNHPSVVIWSLGNEEWAIEGNIKGARIAATMQTYAQQLDSSRAFTAAVSGGWDNGIGMSTQVMGYNYIVQGDIDGHHAKFPWQSGIGTEETTTMGTRGVYATVDSLCHLAAANRMPENVGTESGWKFYASRPFLSGIFYWTGFDYRGEPTPYTWPAICSQFGQLDLCGYPKDIFYYLKSWWGTEPVLHLAPHWTFPGFEGKEMQVTVFSNCDEVELFVNSKSAGRQNMPVNGHLDWNVVYRPGAIKAVGYKNGKKTLTMQHETVSDPVALRISADRYALKSGSADVAILDVRFEDKQGRMDPTANRTVHFDISGPGRIIGVGNGDPSSHDPECFADRYEILPFSDLRQKAVNSLESRPEVAGIFDASSWPIAFYEPSRLWSDHSDSLLVVRGVFEIARLEEATKVVLLSKSILENQVIYVNGKAVSAQIKRDAIGQEFVLDKALVHEGKNTIAFVGERIRKKYRWDEPNTHPGVVQVVTPAERAYRKTFMGHAQVLVQTTGELGTIVVKATSDGIKTATSVLSAIK